VRASATNENTALLRRQVQRSLGPGLIAGCDPRVADIVDDSIVRRAFSATATEAARTPVPEVFLAVRACDSWTGRQCGASAAARAPSGNGTSLPRCRIARAGAGHRQLSASAFRETGFPRAETDGPKSAPGGKKSPRRPNRLRQSPPIAGLWLHCHIHAPVHNRSTRWRFGGGVAPAPGRSTAPRSEYRYQRATASPSSRK
jgi:hypothetical protein